MPIIDPPMLEQALRECINNIAKNKWTFEEAFRASPFKTKQEFLRAIGKAAFNNNGTPYGKVADRVMRDMQRRLGSTTAKFASKEVARTAEKSVIKKIAGRIGVNLATKAVGRSLFVKIVGGLVAGALGVGTILMVGSLAYDGYHAYKGYQQSSSLEEQGVLADNEDVQYFKIYKNIKKNSDEIFTAIYVGQIEFQIDGNGKVLSDYKKTEKGFSIKVEGSPGGIFDGMKSKEPIEKKEPESSKIARDFTGSGNYNAETKELTLNLEGTYTETWPGGKPKTKDIEIDAKGKFNGNNFSFFDFTLTMDGEAMKLQGWKAVKVEYFERNITKEAK